MLSSLGAFALGQRKVGVGSSPSSFSPAPACYLSRTCHGLALLCPPPVAPRAQVPLRAPSSLFDASSPVVAARAVAGWWPRRWHSTVAVSSEPPVPYLTTNAIRSSFLSFFAAHEHKQLSSSNLVPEHDPTLLFTSAGMVPFKPSFCGLLSPPSDRVTTAQKCLRVGGKHNDLDEIGWSPRHHTYFEMLGNFSFGSYDREHAMRLAWSYLTQGLQLPVSRLWVSVLQGDRATAAIWQKLGVAAERIFECGPEDNFWRMGDTGPCGPCTEIFWDMGPETQGERLLEIWNLVFMEQAVEVAGGQPRQLAVPCIDTGMGLERIASVVQGHTSNYDIDTIRPLMLAAEELLQISETVPAVTREAALKVIVDHLRASSMLLAEGVRPDATGRGHVLRRLIRRLSLFAYQVGSRAPFLARLFPLVVQLMGPAHSELSSRAVLIESTLTQEETGFYQSALQASQQFDLLLANATLPVVGTSGEPSVSGALLFELDATYGLPIDLTAHIARARGYTPALEEYQQLKERHKLSSKEKSRVGGSPTADSLPAELMLWHSETQTQNFVGYDQLETPAVIVTAPHHVGFSDSMWLAVDPCPFFAEAGGQVGDKGEVLVHSPEGVLHSFPVVDTRRPYADGIALKVSVSDSHLATDFLTKGTQVTCRVDLKHRSSVENAHTATHLLHAALHSVVGQDLVQAGSKVMPNRLRFDFASSRSLSQFELRAVEDWVNAVIQSDHVLTDKVMSYSEALRDNAVGLFSERYPEQVRVVDVPNLSKEICQGTHAERTGELLAFHIVSQTSIAAGTKRIEAVVGTEAVTALFKKSRALVEVANQLGVNTEAIPQKVDHLRGETVSLKQKLARLQKVVAEGDPLAEDTQQAQIDSVDVTFYRFSSDLFDKKSLIAKAKNLCSSEPERLHVLIRDDEVIGSYSSITPSPQKHCGLLMKNLLNRLGGKGGGGHEMAQGRLVSAARNISDLLGRMRQQQH
eukprot:TRINITY_DN8753_c0_g1_i1.p1 TRINITY_DN8753_c0_g1~~TRINITY_DN8753_c0_g1_i1.p1  ORF type:complete len:982 (+),score=119.56 TRINITY_DN8753_c0_g1_i1:24-2948(+)